jgi:hypothetical protein
VSLASTRRKRALPALLLACSLALTGCASYGNQDLTPAQQALRDKSDRFNETVGTGAAVGAVLGGLLGALAAGNGGRGEAIAIGAASGAALGGGAGYYLASRNERYASREQEIGARVTAARREVYDYQQMASLSDQIRADNEAKLASLDGQLKAGQITADQYRRQTASMAEDVRRLRQALENNEKVQVGIRQDTVRAAGSAAENLRQSQTDLEASRRRIAENTDALVRALRSGPPA